MRGILNRFRRAESPPSELPTDSRQLLRDAKAEVTRAKGALEIAKQGTARARQIIADADVAEATARADEEAWIASVTDGVTRGVADAAAGDVTLAARAEASRAASHRAMIAAKGAAAALDQSEWSGTLDRMVRVEVTAAELEARENLERAETTVKEAIGQIVRETAEPFLRRAEELHAEFVELLPHICGARHQFNGARFGSNPQEFIDRFDAVAEFRFPSFERRHDALREITSPWMEFRNRLLDDSDAKFRE